MSSLFCIALQQHTVKPALPHHRDLQAIVALTGVDNKKLSYHRGTARRAVSVKTVLNVAQMFVELHLVSPATGE